MFVALPVLLFAHQPRLTEARITFVPEPEVSKAYYANLEGGPDKYVIESAVSFNLYVNLLVPDVANQSKNIYAKIIKKIGDKENTATETQVAFLDGKNFQWKGFYEPFGADYYYMGPEFDAQVASGTYEVVVWSDTNNDKYSLAIGKIEKFDSQEIFNVYRIIPKLKTDFFETSPLTFIYSPFGWILLVLIFFFALLVWFIYKLFLKRKM